MHQGEFSRGDRVYVVLRGQLRWPLFREPGDADAFREVLRAALERHAVTLFRHVLLAREVRLLLRQRAENDGIRRVITELHADYARYYKGRHRRTGRVFERRIPSLRLVSEAEWDACAREIELLSPAGSAVGPAA
jgi:hypothetical protein